MTDADKASFGVEMAMLAEVFGEPLSEARLAIYFEDLRVYEFEHVRLGIRAARASKRFFPKVVDIVECLDEAVEARVQQHAMAARGLVLPEAPRQGEIQAAGKFLRLPERRQR